MIAIGISYIGYAPVGDGVPGTAFTPIPNIFKDSVTFNFADASEVKVPIEGSSEPLAIINVKNETDYIEISIPSPSTDELVALAGGSKEDSKDLWNEPLVVPNINKTIKIVTSEYDKKVVEYVIVNGKITAKLSQAPGAEQSELLLVRVYKQAAITAAGEKNVSFTREIKAV